MSRQERQIREKQQADNLHQKQVRRNQILFAIFSAFFDPVDADFAYPLVNFTNSDNLY